MDDGEQTEHASRPVLSARYAMWKVHSKRLFGRYRVGCDGVFDHPCRIPPRRHL